jgi:hypothetical protein
MNFVRSILAFIAAISCLYFALLQLQETSFTFSPIHNPIQINLSLLLLAFFGFGFLSGGLIVWFGRFCKTKNEQKQPQETPTQKELDQILNSSS